MADWLNPQISSQYVSFLDYLKARDDDAAKLFDNTGTNLPVGTIRWSSANNRFEKFDGTNWVELTAQYSINVSSISGASLNDNGITASDLWSAAKIISELNLKANTSLNNVSDSTILSKIKNVDGAGSGLDADLLDGLNSTQFLRSDVENTYTPGFLNLSHTNASISMDDQNAPDGRGIKRITCNDGAGNWNFRSGVYYKTGVGLSYTRAGSGATSITHWADLENGKISLYVAPKSLNADDPVTWTGTFDVTTTGIFFNGNTVWHAGNDGAGSGLDADTLDGLDSTQFIHSQNGFYTENDIRFTVDTIASFRLMSETPKFVYVSGYHAKDDGAFGEAFFKLREGVVPNGTFDNGGTVIETVNGVYDLQYNGDIKARWFGAKLDGVTDDSNALLLAYSVADVVDFENKPVLILSNVNPTGKYIVLKNPETINGAWLFSDFTILGEDFKVLRPNYDSLGRKLDYRAKKDAQIYTDHQNERLAAYSGGVSYSVGSNVNYRVDIANTVGNNGSRPGEKAIVAVASNNSQSANGVAIMAQAESYNGGPIWGLEVVGKSFSLPTTYAHRGAEFAVTGNGLDTNQLRWIIDVVSHNEANSYTGNDSSFVGVHVSPGTADMDYGIYCRNLTAAKYRTSVSRFSTSDETVTTFRTDSPGIDRHYHYSGNSTALSTLFLQRTYGTTTTGTTVAFTEIQHRILTADGMGMIDFYTRDSNGVFIKPLSVRGDGDIYILVNGVSKRVIIGAPDSAGVGFRQLMVEN